MSPYERGERLYRQGDLARALAAWRSVASSGRDYERAQSRLQIVSAEFDRMLRRYEKRAEFFESEERLAEAVLYNRLAYKLDPSRTHLLERVQRLARELEARTQEEERAMQRALEAGRLREASEHAARLKRLDPFDVSLQIEIRQALAAVGTEVLRNLEAGKRAYASGQRVQALRAFEQVLELEPQNGTALGYISYLRPGRGTRGGSTPAPPASISSDEILAEGLYRAGRRAEGSGEPFRALEEYDAALRASAEHAEARSALDRLRRELRPRIEELYDAGKRYFQDEDLHNALRVWRRVLLIDPTHERTRENVERAERILSRLEEIRTDGS
ncbi:MAG: hypothetical protein ACE5FG_00955 [Myxococcota bacterium]